MSSHPVTPMSESDLRLHLARQTNKKIGLIDFTELAEDPQRALKQRQADGAEVVLIDLLDESQFNAVGALLNDHPFIVGSSGVEMALTAYWQHRGLIPGSHQFRAPADAGPIVVASGSCSPVTAAQIQTAIANGFAEVILNPRDLPDSAVRAVVNHLRENRSVILHTGPKADIGGSIVGRMLGGALRAVLDQARVRRVAVAGGDTSGEQYARAWDRREFGWK